MSTSAVVVESVSAINKLQNRKFEDMMFYTIGSIEKKIEIVQDLLSIKWLNRLKGFSPEEKAAVMGLQALVGIHRYKQELSDKDIMKIKSPKGRNILVYQSVFSTLTHDINIKTFEALDKLGYIEIAGKVYIGSDSLITEKLAFGQYREAIDAMYNSLRNNGKGEKEIRKIQFRLTDKPLDLEEIYEQYLKVKGTRGNRDIKRLGIIIEALRYKKIDIEVDEVGMIRINYNAQNSFARRIQMQKVSARKDSFQRVLIEEASAEQALEGTVGEATAKKSKKIEEMQV